MVKTFSSFNLGCIINYINVIIIALFSNTIKLTNNYDFIAVAFLTNGKVPSSAEYPVSDNFVC